MFINEPVQQWYKKIQGLEHLPCEEDWGNWACLVWRTGGLGGTWQQLSNSYEKVSDRTEPRCVYWGACQENERTGINWKRGFWFDIRKKCSAWGQSNTGTGAQWDYSWRLSRPNQTKPGATWSDLRAGHSASRSLDEKAPQLPSSPNNSPISRSLLNTSLYCHNFCER